MTKFLKTVTKKIFSKARKNDTLHIEFKKKKDSEDNKLRKRISANEKAVGKQL